jgi:signal transduction histidine kinase
MLAADCLLGARIARHQSEGNLAPGFYLRLCISDTGTGMDEETLKKAPEPFFPRNLQIR